MFGIGSTELLVILLVALIALGPKSLAGFARTLGKFVGEFRRMSTDFQRAINVEAAQEEARETAAKKAAGEQPSTQTEQNPFAQAAQSEKKQNDFGIPPDSPLAQTLAKAKAEADAAERDVANAMNEVKKTAKPGDTTHG